MVLFLLPMYWISLQFIENNSTFHYIYTQKANHKFHEQQGLESNQGRVG